MNRRQFLASLLTPAVTYVTIGSGLWVPRWEWPVPLWPLEQTFINDTDKDLYEVIRTVLRVDPFEMNGYRVMEQMTEALGVPEIMVGR